MGSKPKPPKVEKVEKIAGEQRGQNAENVAGQQTANRVDQTNQYGSTLDWQSDGVDENGNPKFKQVQGLGDQGQQFATGFNQLGQQYQQGASNLMANAPDFSPDAAFDQAYGFLNTKMARDEGEQEDALRTRYANQGLTEGNEAYDKGLRNLRETQGGVRTDAMNKIEQTMFNQGLQGDQQNISRLQQLGQSGDAYARNTIGGGFAGVQNLNVPNVDLTQLYAQRQQQLNQNYQSQLQSYNGMLGGIAGMGGMVLGGALGGPMGAAVGGSLGGMAGRGMG